jgi:hypothetical protein
MTDKTVHLSLILGLLAGISLAQAVATPSGSLWNSYIWKGSFTESGSVSNLPPAASAVAPNAVAPNVDWSDTLAKPSVAIDPRDSAVIALLYGKVLPATEPTNIAGMCSGATISSTSNGSLIIVYQVVTSTGTHLPAGTQSAGATLSMATGSYKATTGPVQHGEIF